MNGMNEGNDSTISSACELCTLVKRKLLPITFKVYAEKAYDFFFLILFHTCLRTGKMKCLI